MKKQTNKNLTSNSIGGCRWVTCYCKPGGPKPPGTPIITGVGDPTCDVGELGNIYIDLSTGHTYYKLDEPVPPNLRPIPPHTGNTLLVGSTQTYTTIEDALAAANDGDRLLLDAETFMVTSTINVNKSVTIEGQGKGATTVIATSNTVPNIFNVTVSKVVFRNMSIVQDFISTLTTETVILINNIAATGIYIDNCEISVCEFGITISATEFQITNCSFIYSPNAAQTGNSYRYIYIRSTSGQSIIDNNTFISTVDPGQCNFIIITNLASPLLGTLVISNNTQLASIDPLRHLIIMEEFTGLDFELYIINNTTIDESNVPVLLWGPNFNMFKFICVKGNVVQNSAGKGLIGIDSSSIGTTNIFSSENSIANEFFAADWESATIPPSYIVGYRTVITPAPELPILPCYWLPLI